jgi:hypothetical protein
MAGAVRVRRLERRRFQRTAAGNADAAVRARVRPGRDVILLDFSCGGVLVEATSRLLPGGVVDLQIIGQGRAWGRSARVVRCRVSALLADECVRYRAGIEFLRPLDGIDELASVAVPPEPSVGGLDGYVLPVAGSWDTS